MKKAFFFSAFFAIVICISTQKVFSQEKEKVKQLVEDIIAADNRADVNKVLSLYASDAVLMPPDKLSIVGIADIEQNYKAIFTNVSLNLKTTLEVVNVCNNSATAIGINTGNSISKTDGSTKSVNSKYVMLLEQQENGEWKIKRLIWNNN